MPIGLLVHEPGTFRVGWAHVRVGDPVPIEDCRARARSEPEAAVRALTDRLATALGALIVEAEDHDTLQLARALEEVWHAESERPAVRADRAEWLRQSLRAYRYLLPREPARVARLRGEVARYVKDLELQGLTHDQLTRVYPAPVVARYALREGLALLGGLPLALWGLATHALPYGLTALAARLLRPERDAEATVKLAAGVVLYPLGWAALGYAAWRLGGEWALTVFLVALVPTGFFALSWRERLARVRRDARGFFRFLRDRDLLARLAARRRALAEAAAVLSRSVPASVLAGDTEAGCP